jgi:hypothetical protein
MTIAIVWGSILSWVVTLVVVFALYRGAVSIWRSVRGVSAEPLPPIVPRDVVRAPVSRDRAIAICVVDGALFVGWVVVWFWQQRGLDVPWSASVIVLIPALVFTVYVARRRTWTGVAFRAIGIGFAVVLVIQQANMVRSGACIGDGLCGSGEASYPVFADMAAFALFGVVDTIIKSIQRRSTTKELPAEI